MAMETAQEQDLAFERLRLLGDYQHNCDPLALGEGEFRRGANATKSRRRDCG